MEKWKQSGFIILLALFLTACGGGGGGGTPSAGGGGQVIGPNGGAKTSNDQKASVTIPAGALSEEKVVTVEKASNSPSGNIGDARMERLSTNRSPSRLHTTTRASRLESEPRT